MTIDSVLAVALKELAGQRHPRRDAAQLVPRAAGICAFYGDPRAWVELELTPTFDEQPLYVGKAEKNLNGRDVGTHFGEPRERLRGARKRMADMVRSWEPRTTPRDAGELINPA